MTGGKLALRTCAMIRLERVLALSCANSALRCAGIGSLESRNAPRSHEASPQPSGLSATSPPCKRNLLSSRAMFSGCEDDMPKSSHIGRPYRYLRKYQDSKK